MAVIPQLSFEVWSERNVSSLDFGLIDRTRFQCFSIQTCNINLFAVTLAITKVIQRRGMTRNKRYLAWTNFHVFQSLMGWLETVVDYLLALPMARRDIELLWSIESSEACYPRSGKKARRSFLKYKASISLHSIRWVDMSLTRIVPLFHSSQVCKFLLFPLL